MKTAKGLKDLALQADVLTYKEFDQFLQLLLQEEKSTGLEITILDPERDPTGKYTKDFVANFCKSFNLAEKRHIIE